MRVVDIYRQAERDEPLHFDRMSRSEQLLATGSKSEQSSMNLVNLFERKLSQDEIGTERVRRSVDAHYLNCLRTLSILPLAGSCRPSS